MRLGKQEGRSGKTRDEPSSSSPCKSTFLN